MMERQSTMRNKIISYAIGTVVLGAASLVGLTFYARWKLEIPISITQEDRARASDLKDRLEHFQAGVKTGEVSWRRVDFTSVGFPEKEAVLRQLWDGITVFQLRFRRLPKTTRELAQLSTAPSAPRSGVRVDYKKLASECSMVSIAEDSFILNCDDWQPPPTLEKLGSLTKGFDRNTARFYVAGDHVVLFAPPVARRPAK